jgi:hypothetical protein
MDSNAFPKLVFTIPVVTLAKDIQRSISSATTIARQVAQFGSAADQISRQFRTHFEAIERLKSMFPSHLVFPQPGSMAAQASEMLRRAHEYDMLARIQVGSIAEEISRAGRIPSEMFSSVQLAYRVLCEETASIRKIQYLVSAATSPFGEIATRFHELFERQIAERHRRVVEVLAKRGWVGLERYLSESHFERILSLNRTRRLKVIDDYVCLKFARGSHRRLAGLARRWTRVPYMKANRKEFREALAAHKASRYASAIAILLRLIDGLAAEIAEKALGASRKVIRVTEVAKEYNISENTVWSECVQRVISEIYQHVDFSNMKRPKLNRHAILHGRVKNYASEANSLRVILMMDTMVEIALALQKRA